MAKLDVKQLVGIVETQFSAQMPARSLWQTIADHFYPERADFTKNRAIGDELGDGLLDSYPIIARRDLGNSLQSMLRDGHWFDITAQSDVSSDSREWLEFATRTLYELMNARESGFIRAMREADHDYVTFGQSVVSIEVNRLRNGLLYRCWHLRDCAWWEDETGEVSGVVRKWSPTYHDMMMAFGDKCHQRIKDDHSKTPFATVEMRHIVMPSGMYGDDEISGVYKWVSIYLDSANQHIVECVGLHHQHYVVSRFFTLSGQPYAVSPATIAGLPNARLLQSMTYTLMEAAERLTRPPIIAQHNVIRGDVDLSANGVTFIDSEYDERGGEALRPLMQSGGGMPFGLEMKADVMRLITSAFYLDKLSMPDTSGDKTAYEVQELMKQYRREALPLISPIEVERSAKTCDVSFDIAMTAGFMGTEDLIPEEIQGQDVTFRFKSPLTESEGEDKLRKFDVIIGMAERAAALDKQVLDVVDFDETFRGACEGGKIPVKWTNNEKTTMKMRQAQTAALQAGGAPGVEINE